MEMKESKQYYFSVEGETEKWYFEHLKQLINDSPKTKYKVKWEPKIQKSPLKYVKTIALPYTVHAFHICDYESNDAAHILQFKKTLEELKEAKKIKSTVLYKLGYSNYAFELWMILHKTPYLTSLAHRRQYIDGINTAYGENFQFLADYKEENNFKRVLSKIEISDVKQAIKNASRIRKYHEEAEHTISENYKFIYYKDNPDLTINECVEEILHSCGLL